MMASSRRRTAMRMIWAIYQRLPGGLWKCEQPDETWTKVENIFDMNGHEGTRRFWHVHYLRNLRQRGWCWYNDFDKMMLMKRHLRNWRQRGWTEREGRWWWGAWWSGWWGCWHDDADERHLRNRRQRGWTEREGSGEARRGWRIRPQRRQGLNIFDSLIWNLFVTLIVNLSGVRSLESFSIRPDLGWSGWWSLSKRTTASARG